MKHGILVFVFLIVFFDLVAQKEKVKTYYSNGKLKSKGLVYSFGNYDNRIPKSYNYFKSLKKKDGEWKFYYQNGNLSRIESYKATPDLKNLVDLKHGKWVYYNEQGIKYREDFYNDGIIYNSVRLLSWLKANPKTNISITGHTDNIGSDDYNLGLSVDRAKSVYNWLITRGVDLSRLEYKGLGKTQPLYEESTGEFRALNRRVEIKIIQP